MIIRVALGKWADSPDLMPNVISATDNYAEDEWGGLPDFYVKEVNEHRASTGDVRELLLEVPDGPIAELFVNSLNYTPKVSTS